MTNLAQPLISKNQLPDPILNSFNRPRPHSLAVYITPDGFDLIYRWWAEGKVVTAVLGVRGEAITRHPHKSVFVLSNGADIGGWKVSEKEAKSRTALKITQVYSSKLDVQVARTRELKQRLMKLIDV